MSILARAILGSALLATGAARAQGGSAQSFFQAAYSAEAAAWEHKDLNGIFASDAPNIVWINGDGSRIGDLAPMRAQQARNLDVCSRIQARATVEQVQTSGREAVVRVRFESLEQHINLKPQLLRILQSVGLDAVPMTRRIESEDRWAQTPQGWRKVSVRALGGEIKVQDGWVDSTVHRIEERGGSTSAPGGEALGRVQSAQRNQDIANFYQGLTAQGFYLGPGKGATGYLDQLHY